MTTVALDLSVNSTGIAIATDDRQVTFIRLTPRSYDKVRGCKWTVSLHNAMHIANELAMLLMPYRFDDMHIVIESVGFGLLKARTNSATALLFEGAIVASKLVDMFNATVDFVEPTKHKKLFTGNGKATKECSVAQLLHWFPQLTLCSNKLDDIADAMSIMTYAIPDIRTYTCKFIAM